MEEILQAHQFDGLHHAGIAHHYKLQGSVVALFGQLHEGPKAGGIEEVDPAEVDHQGQAAPLDLRGHELRKLFVGIGIKLARELEQHALGPPFIAAPQGYRQSLQIVDRSKPLGRIRGKCSERNRQCHNRNRTWAKAQRRWAIKSAKRAKWWSASWGPGLASGWYCTPNTG